MVRIPRSPPPSLSQTLSNCEIHVFLASSGSEECGDCPLLGTWLVEGFYLQAGKGRTGTGIAVFFLYSGLFDNVEKTLSYFACKRSNNNWGVTNPSQVR